MTSSTTAPAWYTRCLSAENFSHADENYDEDHESGGLRKTRPHRHPGTANSGRRANRRATPRDVDDDLRHRRAHSERRIPVAPGRIVGHEPVGVIERLGNAI